MHTTNMADTDNTRSCTKMADYLTTPAIPQDSVSRQTCG